MPGSLVGRFERLATVHPIATSAARRQTGASMTDRRTAARVFPAALARNFSAARRAGTSYDRRVPGRQSAGDVLGGASALVTGWLFAGSSSSSRWRWRCVAIRCSRAGCWRSKAVLIGLTTPRAVYHETTEQLAVILLLMIHGRGHLLPARAAAVHLHEDLLGIGSRTALALLTFCLAAALLSAFLDALTVIAVVITVGLRASTPLPSLRVRAAASTSSTTSDATKTSRSCIAIDLEAFRAFLRRLMMHAAGRHRSAA